MFERTDATYNTNEYNLSIRISSDGFSLSIQDANNKSLLAKNTNADLYSLTKKEIKDLLYSESDILLSDYNNINIIVETDNYTFIPKSIFQIAEIDTYYNFLFPKDKKQLVTFNPISRWETTNIYSLYSNLNKVLEEFFPETNIQHQLSYLLSEKALTKEDHIYIWRRPKFIDVILIRNSELTLLNSYSYEATEDAVYHILRLVEEFKLDVEKVKISLYQRSNQEDLYTILSLYIKYCKILPQQ